MKAPEQVIVSERDYARLELLLASMQPAAMHLLEAELARALVLHPDEMPPNVVTMNSRVRFQDEQSGELWEVHLVFPEDADVQEGRISVLAPVGSALLGLSEGDSIEWPVPSGRVRKLKIVSVLYQPEAEGRYDQ